MKFIPTPHDFRRAFALIMLRNGVDIFALQKLMGHSDLQILLSYLAQTDQDIHTAHMRGSPVDGNLWNRATQEYLHLTNLFKYQTLL